MPRHRSSAVPLSWLYVGLIVYASLYPFAGWRVPGVGPLDFLLLGWPHWWTTFDLVSNLLGYLPLGFLLFVALIRGGRRPAPRRRSRVAVGDAALVHDGAAAELPAAARLVERRSRPQRARHRARRRHRRCAALARRHRALAEAARPLVRRAQRRRPGAARPLADRPAVPDRGAVRPRPRARPDPAARSSSCSPGHAGGGVDRGLDRRRGASAGGAAGALAGGRARDHRPRPARAVPGRVHDRRAGLAPRRCSSLGAALLGAATTTLSTALNFGPQPCASPGPRSRRSQALGVGAARGAAAEPRAAPRRRRASA